MSLNIFTQNNKLEEWDIHSCYVFSFVIKKQQQMRERQVSLIHHNQPKDSWDNYIVFMGFCAFG